MTRSFPTLYSRTKGKAVQQWDISAIREDNRAFIEVRHGQLDGQFQLSRKEIFGKSIGRSNETTPFYQAILEAESKWKKQKTLKYSESIPDEDQVILLPMLAHKYLDHKKKVGFPCYVQPKFNGARVLPHKISPVDVEYITRGNKKWTTLGHITPYITRMVEQGIILDGEIYNHDMHFQEIISAIKKLNQNTRRLKLFVYDIAIPNKTFAERLQILQSFPWPKDGPIELAPTFKAYNGIEIKEYYDHFVSQGYEGLIIRNAHGFYEFNHRSHNLLKYKDFQEEEFVIVGGKAGRGTHEGCCVFECKPNVTHGTTFWVVPKGSLEYQRELLRNLPKYIGKLLTVSFLEYSMDGTPMGNTVGKAIRDYE